MRDGLITVILLILLGCASRSVPTGGPKDEDPPRLVSMYPESGTTNYKENKIRLEFDEKIDVSNLKDELLVTPFLDMEIEYSVKKNVVEFEFEEEFPDSTTVSLNFRNSIVDITEKNPAENLVLAFSTGPVIDSLKVRGFIEDFMKGTPMEGFNVGLYENNDTIDLFNSKPLYQFTTAKSGTFDFQYIKNGSYKLYTFLDKNRDGLCQSSREPFGFYPGIIELDSNVNQIQIQTQFLNLDTLELSSARQTGKYFLAKFNKPIVNYSLSVETGDSLVSVLEKDNQTIKFYETIAIEDSLQVIVSAQDSLYTTAVDTFHIKFEETTRKPDQLQSTIVSSRYYSQENYYEAIIEFSKPISSMQLDSIFLQLDSAVIIYPDSTWETTYSNVNRQVKITFPNDTLIEHYLTQPKNDFIKFRTGSSAFISLELDSSVVMSSIISLVSPEMYGVLAGYVTPDSISSTIELLDKNYNVLDRLNVSSFRLENLKPEIYQLRALIDENENGYWDPVDVYQLKPSEPIWYYEDPDNRSREIPLKANWEVIDLEIKDNKSTSLDTQLE